jgi:hypothetical protein
MARPMTDSQRISYTRIALALVKIGVDDATSDLIIRVMDAVNEKQGDFTLRDAAIIEAKVREKYKRSPSLKKNRKKSKP